MINCTRILEFDAGHRLIRHEGKCRFLHGHRYKMEISFCVADKLDDIGRVIDFGVIKQILGTWIDENLDHTTILHEDDRKLGDFVENHTKQKIYYMKENPTAENIASHIFNDIVPILFHNKGIICTRIKLHETPNCSVCVD
ncbi:6-pyruvoyl trahydropterin synthase family protein [Candidatus Deianiraea vastatrix]|uniref:6-carboxy-5,6,7,8-tetrahydropterin synthase n=1 Tax=Candidatus Deianiraea vastatrix TaxID=2163644 RepID=A0A5B8XDR1_9RICK|nr:6-carboxytetrahydropterin synthase [Candidatus Deianiraea vastatrix]QED23403.1 6-carboxy-5,6,7,8-tetrahydropterin synthase [Candidatus Deianiraea vastatrix]